MKHLLTKMTPTVARALTIGLMLAMFVPMALAATATGDLISPTDNPDIIAGRTGSEGSFRNLALVVLNFGLSFLGFIAVIFVIYGGILYVTSGGEQEKVDSGKKILMYAGGGLLIILISFALVNTILSAGTGIEPA